MLLWNTFRLIYLHLDRNYYAAEYIPFWNNHEQTTYSKASREMAALKMKIDSLKTNKYGRLVELLRKRRADLSLQQAKISKELGVTQSWVSKVENLDIKLDIEALHDYASILGVSLAQLLIDSGFIDSGSASGLPTSNSTLDNVITPDVSRSYDKDNGLMLCLVHGDTPHFVHMKNMNLKDYHLLDKEISLLFRKASTDSTFKNREAISEALSKAIRLFPQSNPSDLYHHIVYRTYLREYNKTNPKQSWVRSGGEAVELLLKELYGRKLAQNGIELRLAFEKGVDKNQFLIDMKLADSVPGKSKLDIGLYGDYRGQSFIFGGIHSKASLAERVSDDIPCSVAMMEANYYSYLFTFDCKSFPPPAGNLFNKGELGSHLSPTDKREYIEKHGKFTTCFSFNFNTEESPMQTESGSRIIVPSRVSECDSMINKIIADWEKFKKSL